jgi:hypothetical protein
VARSLTIGQQSHPVGIGSIAPPSIPLFVKRGLELE